jgi:hypothetical protein
MVVEISDQGFSLGRDWGYNAQWCVMCFLGTDACELLLSLEMESPSQIRDEPHLIF